MNVTDVKVRRIYHEGRMRAVVSLTFDDALVVHDIKVIDLDGRIFVAMPSRRDEDGKFRDVVHPINPETRRLVEEAVLAAYRKALDSLIPLSDS